MKRLFAIFAILAAVSAGEAARAAAEPCAYGDLAFGPISEFALADDVLISPDARFALTRTSDDEPEILFANGGGAKPLKEASERPVVILNDREIGIVQKGALVAIDARTGARRPAGPKDRDQGVVVTRASAGKSVKAGVNVLPLYSTVMLMKVMPADSAAYAAFRKDILAGTYCGADIGKLAGATKTRAAELFKFMLFDDLSAGRMEDYAGWLPLVNAIHALMTDDTLDGVLDAYCFRATEAAQADPLLSKVDPNKVWSFVWAAVVEHFADNTKLVQPGDFVHFTDISVYQRDGAMAFALLGTKPLAGGLRNKYGFYQLAAGGADLRSLAAPQTFDFHWSQDDKNYDATIAVSPSQNRLDVKSDAFPGPSHHGLVLMDKTLSATEVRNNLKQYRIYYERAGFHFAPQRALPDVIGFLARDLPPTTDYILRDGHADGDDDNLIALYEDGFILSGEKPDGDSLSLVFNLSKDAKARRLSYEEFAALLGRLDIAGKRPLVYLDTSCWGLEKAWVSLSIFKASQLMQISSRTPVNFLRGDAEEANNLLLDAIRSGGDFASLRGKLQALPDYSSGKSDNFVFPDEAEYPQAHPLAQVSRQLFVRDADGKPKAYTPDGYF